MCAQHGNGCLSSKNGCTRCEQFGNGSIRELGEHRPGRTVEAATLNTFPRASGLMYMNPPMTDEIRTELNSSHELYEKLISRYSYIHQYNKIIMMLHMINVTHNTLIERCSCWLQVVLIPAVDGSANNGLSVVSCRHFMKNACLEELIETSILYLRVLSSGI
jgi:hypothetical protein